jgi:hypothetical protein
MLVLIHYCVLIYSLKNIAYEVQWLARRVSGTGSFGIEVGLQPKEVRTIGRAGHPGWSFWLGPTCQETPKFLAPSPSGIASYLALSCLL